MAEQPTVGQAFQGLVPPGQPQAQSQLVQGPQPVAPLNQLPQPGSQPLRSPTPPKELQLFTGVQIPRHVKAFVFGEGGSGKTVFAGSAPNPVYLDTENSSEALLDWPELLEKCKVAKFRWEHKDAVLQMIRNGHEFFADRQTIILDTIDGLQRNNLEHVLAGTGRDPFLPMEHDYKKSGEMLRRFVLDLRDLPFHIIILCHAESVFSEGGALMKIRPGCTPKLAKTLMEEFSITGYMALTEKDPSKPFANGLQTRSDAAVIGKSRLRFLPTVIHNPSFSDILAIAEKRGQQQQGVATS